VLADQPCCGCRMPVPPYKLHQRTRPRRRRLHPPRDPKSSAFLGKRVGATPPRRRSAWFGARCIQTAAKPPKHDSGGSPSGLCAPAVRALRGRRLPGMMGSHFVLGREDHRAAHWRGVTSNGRVSVILRHAPAKALRSANAHAGDPRDFQFYARAIEAIGRAADHRALPDTRREYRKTIRAAIRLVLKPQAPKKTKPPRVTARAGADSDSSQPGAAGP